jgi:predicted O-methyltransferase YrrM
MIPIPDPEAPCADELFTMSGRKLPCWLKEDSCSATDDWLTAASNYPAYYSLFRRLTHPASKTRLLEIGVRTGYIPVVFAKASRGLSYYLGVDPNLYLQNGLTLASQSLQHVQSCIPTFDFALIEGYSWDDWVRKSIMYSGPFDLIHIDGDHTLGGKLVDLDIARFALADNGIILVDDYDHHPCVREAVERAIRVGIFRQFAYLPTFRGLAALRP